MGDCFCESYESYIDHFASGYEIIVETVPLSWYSSIGTC